MFSMIMMNMIVVMGIADIPNQPLDLTGKLYTHYDLPDSENIPWQLD
jgi:hypothetical protein